MFRTSDRDTPERPPAQAAPPKPSAPLGPGAKAKPVEPKPTRRPSGLLATIMPNQVVSANTMRLLIVGETALALLVWLNSPFKVLPRPDEVGRALQSLWMEQGLGPELWVSFKLNVEALVWTAFLSLVLSYLTVLPMFRPLVAALSKGRFVSLAGFTLLFTLMVGGGHVLKLSLLVFAMTVFFVTSMASVVATVPRSALDYARTLRMGEWRVVWEVVVLGTADTALEVLRQNAAIGWMMLTMVEGIVRSEGGVGAMLLGESKHFRLAEVFAIQLLILCVGLVQDYALGALRRLLCPYADLTRERQVA